MEGHDNTSGDKVKQPVPPYGRSAPSQAYGGPQMHPPAAHPSGYGPPMRAAAPPPPAYGRSPAQAASTPASGPFSAAVAAGACHVPMWDVDDYACVKNEEMPVEEEWVDSHGRTRMMMLNEGTCTIRCPGAKSWLVPGFKSMQCKEGEWHGVFMTPVVEMACKTAGWCYCMVVGLPLLAAAAIGAGVLQKHKAALAKRDPAPQEETPADADADADAASVRSGADGEGSTG